MLQRRQLPPTSFAKHESGAGLEVAGFTKLQHSALDRPYQKDPNVGYVPAPQQLPSTSSNKKGKQKQEQPTMDTFHVDIGSALGGVNSKTRSYRQVANVQGLTHSQEVAYNEEPFEEETLLDSLDGYCAFSEALVKELMMLPNFLGDQVSDKLSGYLQRKPHLAIISGHCAGIRNGLQRLSQTRDAKKLAHTLDNVRLMNEFIEGQEQILQLWFNIQTPENQDILTSLLHQAQSSPQPSSQPDPLM